MAIHPLPRRRRNPFASRRRSFLEWLERRDLLSTYTTPEDTPLTVDNGGLAGVTVVAGPLHGKLTLSDKGGFVYSPNLNYNGNDRFLYSATSTPPTTTNTGDLKEISISVTPVNDPPEAHNDSYPAQQGVALKIDSPGVLKNDTDVDSDHLTAQLETKPGHGDLTLGDNGSFTYTPAGDFTGLDTFTYRATDGSATSALATVGINVAPANTAPIARPDGYTTPQNTELDQPAPGVLSNDTGVSGRPLKASLEHDAEHGSVVMKEDGSFTYKPAQDFFGFDKFVYRATDVSPLANPLPPAYALGTVTVYVRPTTPVVIANGDEYNTPPGAGLGVDAPGVLKNDYVLPVLDQATAAANGTGPSSIPLNATLVTDVSHGKLSLKQDGSFQYTPSPGYVGDDSFTYRAIIAQASGTGSTSANTVGSVTSTDPNTGVPIPHDVATVTIHVKPLPPPPPPVQASSDSYRTLEETPLTVDAPGVLANDHGPTGHTLAAILVNDAHGGDLKLNEDGSFTYAPHGGFTGNDSFTYRAVDKTASGSTAADGAVATVSIFVQALHPPVYATDDTYHTPAGTPLKIDDPGVLGNDSLFRSPPLMGPGGEGEWSIVPNPPISPVPSNVKLTAKLVDGPAHGKLTLSETGGFSYTPDPDFTGADTFTYQATATIIPDPTTGGGSAAATVSTILGATIPIAGVPCFLGGDGTAICPPFPGNDNIATVTIYVKAPEPPPGPVAANDNFTTAENTPLNESKPGVLANDYVRVPNPGPLSGVVPALAVNNDVSRPIFPLKAVLVTDASHGKLTLNSDGSFKYTPDTDFVGDDTFTYQAQEILPPADGAANDTGADPTTGTSPPILSNIATVTIHVVPALAHNDVYSTPQDQPLKIDAPGVLNNDSGGSQAHPLEAAILSLPLHGKVTLNRNGSFTYSPDPGFAGSDVFTYRASDGTTPGDSTGDDTTGGISTTNSDPITGGVSPIPAHDGDVGVVRIYVKPASTSVEAHNDKYPTPVNVPLKIDAPGVLANDGGPLSHPLSASLVDQPAHGKLTLGTDGGFTYSPDQDFVGEDHFVYRASDSTAATNATNSATGATGDFPGGSLAVVTIYVLPTDPQPKVVPGPSQNATDESGPQKIADWATVVSVGGDGKPSFVISTDNPRLFAAPPSLDATGQLTYTPAPNVSGSATVTINMASGGQIDPGTAQTFTINIDKPHPLYNAAQPCDVNDDNVVAPNDVLMIINYLNARAGSTAGAAEGEAASIGYLDVSKDGFVAPNDALAVINAINARQGAGSAGSSASGAVQDASTEASLLTLLAQDVADATQGKRRTS